MCMFTGVTQDWSKRKSKNPTLLNPQPPTELYERIIYQQIFSTRSDWWMAIDDLTSMSWRLMLDLAPGCLAHGMNQARVQWASHCSFSHSAQGHFLRLLLCHFIRACNSKAITYKLTWGVCAGGRRGAKQIHVCLTSSMAYTLTCRRWGRDNHSLFMLASSLKSVSLFTPLCVL